MCSTIHEIITDVNVCLQKNKINEALTQLKIFVEGVISNCFLNGILTNIPEIDNLCIEIGKKVLLSASPQTRSQLQTTSSTIVYIATQFYLSGGHTAVVIDFIKAQPNKPQIVLLTDIFESNEKKSIEERFSNLPVKLYFAPQKTTYHEKLLWLQNKWLEVNPEKVFLFNHPQDSVAIAAAQPEMPGKLFFYHHADYTLALGSRIKHAKHIDMNPLLFYQCQSYKVDNLYCPLICDDYSVKDKPKKFMQNGKINTASSGYFEKFNQSYLYSYVELLPEILCYTGGNHLHIGFLPQKMLNLIQENLIKAKVSLEKFIYLPLVKSVLTTIIEHEVDLYISSFPIGGGRTAIEVMASGTPVLSHLNYRSIFLSENHYLYPQAFLWKTPEELKEIIQNLTPQTLAKHSLWSRKHYEENYLPEFLTNAIKDDFNNSKPVHHITIGKIIPNPTQLFLDINNNITKLNCELNSIKHNFMLTHLKKFLKMILKQLRFK